MEKCSFCGGKVVNGRCEDCGMPFPTEKRYTLRGENVHTHEVNGEKILHRVRQTLDKKPVYSRPAERRGRTATPRPPVQRQKSLVRFTWGIVVLVLLINFLPALITSCAA